MALTNYLYGDFFGEMDRVFNRFEREERGFMDVIETSSRFELVGDFPGYDAKDIVIEQSGGVLTIRGERKNEVADTKEKGTRWHRRERSYASFYKSYTLPNNVDAENITASLDKGVLRLFLPKLAEKTRRRIKID